MKRRTIGHYEISDKLGAGGMGEVYRGRDPKLGREVAIKMLPEAFAADPERIARLEREARLLASLNHTSIAHLYGLESATLENGRTGLFLVMELAEGEDLAARLSRGAIPIEDALAIARQLAAALEEAHEKGIVHRDLKPANVMLGRDGTVKVLDFGLAKAYAEEPVDGASSNLSQSPTLAQTGTMAGAILGTAAYMSPEQARGKPIDKRADIWAFGVVLYEVLTGSKLFSGETLSDTLAAVLRQEVDWRMLPERTPAAVRRLLARCLQRDPKRRLRDIGDARIVVDEALSGEPPVGGMTEQVSAGRPGRRALFGWAGAALLGVALAIGMAGGWLIRRPAVVDAPPGPRWALAIPEGVTLSTAVFPQLALSRDGTLQVVVVVDESSTPHLLIRHSNEFEARILPDTERAGAPFLSPDGTWIAFFRDSALFKIPAVGGPPVRLATTSGQVRGGTWSSDGFIYYTPDTNVSISRIPENGGEPQQVTRLDEARDERTHRWPHALPGGEALLFTCDTQGSTEYYDDARIETVRPATGERTVLVEGSSQGWYSPGGHLIFARGGSLYAIALDPATLETHGSPLPVVQGVATDVSSGAVQFAVAQSGAALWAPGGTRTTSQVGWVDRGRAETIAAVPPAPYNELALSPDGRRLALVGGEGGVSDLWVADLERGGMSRLTFGEYVAGPVWTPDGSRIVYSTRVQGTSVNTWRLAWKPADGSRDAETLVEGPRGQLPTAFTSDGQFLIYDSLTEHAAARNIWVLPLEEPRQPRLLIEDDFMKREAVLSPDDRWLAYVSSEGGRPSVFVRPFPEGEGRWQISTPTGVEPRWSQDGKELFYRDDQTLYRVPVRTDPTFSAGRPEPLFDRAATSGSGIHTYTPSPDGSRFMTFRLPQGAGSLRTLHIDLGFAQRLDTVAAP